MLNMKNQKGYALTEILLATIIIVPLTILGIQRQAAGLQETVGVANAEETMGFTELAKNYYLANPVALRAAMSDGTDAANLCRLGVIPTASTPETTGMQANSIILHTCAIDASLLKWKGFAPGSFSDFNSQKQRMVVVFRRIYVGAVASDNVELLSFGASGAIGMTGYAPNSTGVVGTIDPLVRDAKVLGASGGIIPDDDRVVCKWVNGDPTQQEACGSSGGWKVKLSDFIGL